MVRSLAVGFGMVTALAVAGSMTPAGQGMLGQRHAAEQSVPVSSIQDKPVAIPGPSQALVAAPSAAHVASPAGSPAPRRPQAAAAPRATQPPQAGRPAQPQGGPGGVAGIANILLNLPQILDQTHVGPSHGSDSWSGQGAPAGPDSGRPHKKRRLPQDQPTDDEPHETH